MNSFLNTLLDLPPLIQFILTGSLGIGWLVASHLDEYHRATWRPRGIYSYMAYAFGLPSVAMLLLIMIDFLREPSRRDWFALVAIGVCWVCVHTLAQRIVRTAVREAPFQEDGPTPKLADSPYKHRGT